ncbi:inositol-pentakisphosphate 2-kinase-like isoform X1 [Tripterygium wilfordii]|uniref:Inositol-pentakisphosphate 2-kinase n=2 Tax=Tripterygium wilfordii TaxID=458696 RepID=A0A7J7D3Y8_TRIWF|nr:inositol-pentakisphosphate 2-kinase-like isoform X2 [Tripterygium wilfordii]XP_038716253.1 inositol-pentakisphosphate 2-kinase-like isoform X2 [Tripterygium wilfordii]KAF5740786.1 inositol-pentakisphosphate 2-kinase-like isoform X1 [Tripterygium wilfordii]
MEVVLQEKDAADWVYRGEGGANLVLAYCGSSPAFVGKVMRVQKEKREKSHGHRRKKSERPKSPSSLTVEERLLWKDAGELISSPTKEIMEQVYVQHVISPLLGPKHVDPGIRILVSREFLESIEKNVIFQRPAWRVDAARVDMSRDSTLLMSDHSLFPLGTLKGQPFLSVEIKPKCGYLPFSRYIAERNAIKRSITRFKMHQVLKLRQHEISELSEYDPLNLFSGSKGRIQKAIKALYATPQNNFRVFLNGSLILGGLGGGTNKTNIGTEEAFENQLKCLIQAGNGMRTESFIHLVTEAVYNSGVLDRLLEAQKLDNLDIEGAIHAYYDIISQPCRVCGELGEDELPHRYASLHSIPLDESLKIVKDFLIAVTVKDCSMMISFRPRVDGELGSSYNCVYLESTKQSFDYKVHFIDLDLKPLRKMEDYYNLDKKILKCYTEEANTKDGADKALTMQPYETISL